MGFVRVFRDMTELRAAVEAEFGEWGPGEVFQSDPDNPATSLRQVQANVPALKRAA